MKLLKIIFVITFVSTNNVFSAAGAEGVRAVARRAWTAGPLLPSSLRGLKARQIPGAPQVAFPKTYPTWPAPLSAHPGTGLLWKGLTRRIYEFGDPNSNLVKLLRHDKSGMFNLFQQTFRPSALKSNPFYSFSGKIAGEVIRAVNDGSILETKTLDSIATMWRAQHLEITGEQVTRTRINQALQLIVRAAEDEIIGGKIPPGSLGSVLMSHQVMLGDAAKSLPNIYRHLGIELSHDPGQEQPQNLPVRDNPTEFLVRATGADENSIIPPPVQQGYPSFKGQPPRPDCVEASMHEFINMLAFDPTTGTFKLQEALNHLPLSQGLIDFYQRYDQADGSTIVNSREDFYNIVSGLPGIEYLAGDNEIKGSVENIVQIYNRLLGTTATNFDELAQQLSSEKMTVSITPVESRRDFKANKTYGLFDIEINDKVYNRKFKIRISIEPGHSEICERPRVLSGQDLKADEYPQGDPTSVGALLPITPETGEAFRLKVNAQDYNLMANYPGELWRVFESDVLQAVRLDQKDLIEDIVNKYVEVAQRSGAKKIPLSSDIIPFMSTDQLIKIMPYQKVEFGQDVYKNIMNKDSFTHNPLLQDRFWKNYVETIDDVYQLSPFMLQKLPDNYRADMAKRFGKNLLNNLRNKDFNQNSFEEIYLMMALGQEETVQRILHLNPHLFENNKGFLKDFVQKNPTKAQFIVPLLSKDFIPNIIDNITHRKDSDLKIDIALLDGFNPGKLVQLIGTNPNLFFENQEAFAKAARDNSQLQKLLGVLFINRVQQRVLDPNYYNDVNTIIKDMYAATTLRLPDFLEYLYDQGMKLSPKKDLVKLMYESNRYASEHYGSAPIMVE